MISFNRKEHSFILEWLLTAAMAFILLWILVFTDTSRAVGHMAYDHMMRFRGFDRTQDIVVVSIDDRTLNRLGEWPLQRKHYTNLLNKLSAPEFRPKAIGIDLLFLDSTNEDLALAQAMRQHHVVLPVEFKVREDTTQSLTVITPAAVLESAATLAHINLNVDADGMIRGVDTFANGMPQLAIAMHRLVNPDIQAPEQGDEHRRFNMVDPKIGFPTVSLADALEDNFPLALFKNKYVLIGVNAPGLGDRYPTLYAGENSQSTPGVDIIASVLKSSIEQSLIATKDSTQSFIVFGLILFIMLISLLRLTPRQNIQLTGFVFAISIVGSYVLLSRFHLWLDPTPLMLVLLVLQPIWSWRRLETILYLVRQKTLDLRQDESTSALPAGLQPSQDIVQRYSQLLDVAVNAARGQLDFLELVVNELPDSVVIFDHNGKLVLKNKKADDLVMEGSIHIGQERDEFCKVLNIPHKLAEPKSIELPVQNEDDTPLPVIKIFDAADVKDFFFKTAYLKPEIGNRLQIMILTEITELRRIQAQRDRALSFLSHDMRTPIASILAVSSEATSAHESDLHDKISHHAHLLLRMVDDFIMTIKVESTVYRFEEQLLDNLIDDAIEQVADLAQNRSIEISNDLDPEGAFLKADSKLLVRTLMNLLVNAIKFSPEGGTIEISSRMADSTHVVLTIRNPIAPAQERGVADKAQGYGLGLQFVDNVLDRHNATITRDIPASGWAQVDITFPCLID